ncbi:hypothetical protein ACFSL4_04075 [Streptomyces caeni]|uniref:Uncharacterized protein n=1 Tax=Streptomyces caeni TaxID=2307231 RepID=A0ABW4IKY7_9ACTN
MPAPLCEFAEEYGERFAVAWRPPPATARCVHAVCMAGASGEFEGRRTAALFGPWPMA